MRTISRRQALLATSTAAITSMGCGRNTTHGNLSVEQDEKRETIEYRKHEILMLVYPRFTILDLIGPQHVFALLGPEYKTRLVWKDRNVVTSDTGVPVMPTMTFDECPDKPTILFIPGGTDGTLAAMEDETVRSFVAKAGIQSTYVTSVCTGSLLLGAAGLLGGYQATTHWLAMRLLAKLGAKPVDERVVVDRNRVTGAGVTAGIDFALTLTAMLMDSDYAKTVQLMMEYDPKPPFQSGNRAAASEETVRLLEGMSESFLQDVEESILKRFKF